MNKLIALFTVIFISFGTQALPIKAYEEIFKNDSDPLTKTAYSSYRRGIVDTVFTINNRSGQKKLFCGDIEFKKLIDVKEFNRMIDSAISKFKLINLYNENLDITEFFLFTLGSENPCK